MRRYKISENIWEIPVSEKEGMIVPARIYAGEGILNSMEEGVFEQITNVACLPGIQRYALCMPDGHWGYGFPIGGVAAFSVDDGIISPGGIGFDINCGVRLIKTDLVLDEVTTRIDGLIEVLFRLVPAGVGSKGIIRLERREFEDVMTDGAGWCIKKGYGWHRDLDRIEESGAIEGADPSTISKEAVKRGINQLGTLGSGNHYLEIQVVTDIIDERIAHTFGIYKRGQILVMVHCGSRGFGHQIGTDYLRDFDRAMNRYGITVKDRQLACAPFRSPEGSTYYKAMLCAANMAFANRQVISHRIREGFSKVFGQDPERLGMDIVYDVAHNIAKIERYHIDGEMKEVIVHRKGATRSFGTNRGEIAEVYRDIGQPVIVGGSMETASYLLVGTDKAISETFGSTMHGCGRTMSRRAAKRAIKGKDLQERMHQRGIVVKAVSMSGLAEEAGMAYKDISEVVDAMDSIGISKKVVELRPIGNIKG